MYVEPEIATTPNSARDVKATNIVRSLFVDRHSMIGVNP
jgi:hypothetical protein